MNSEAKLASTTRQGYSQHQHYARRALRIFCEYFARWPCLSLAFDAALRFFLILTRFQLALRLVFDHRRPSLASAFDLDPRSLRRSSLLLPFRERQTPSTLLVSKHLCSLFARPVHLPQPFILRASRISIGTFHSLASRARLPPALFTEPSYPNLPHPVRIVCNV